MAKGYDDSNLVFNLASRLRARTETLCRDQANLQCSMSVRAFVFSTGLLAKNYQWQDSNLTCRQLDEAIEILRHGDQECLIYALALSRLLEAKLMGHDNVKAMAEERRRAEAMRSNIREIRLSNSIEIAREPDDNPKNYFKNIQSRRKREGDEFRSWLVLNERGHSVVLLPTAAYW
jgi:hypothetical protein